MVDTRTLMALPVTWFLLGKTSTTKQLNFMKNDKELIPRLNGNQTKEALIKSVQLPMDLSFLLREMSSVLAKENNDITNIEVTDEFTKRTLEIFRGLELETHIGLIESVEELYRPFIKEFCSQIINDYSCTTSIERALAEQIANAHVRIIDNSRRLNGELNCRDMSPHRNSYIANLSKQLDRAHRQFDSALFALRQIKQPQLSVNVKATNAFVSHNQQINTTDESEIIES